MKHGSAGEKKMKKADRKNTLMVEIALLHRLIGFTERQQPRGAYSPEAKDAWTYAKRATLNRLRSELWALTQRLAMLEAA
jgi:hypothetical protein